MPLDFVICLTSQLHDRATTLSESLHVPLLTTYPDTANKWLAIVFEDNRVSLQVDPQQKFKPLSVDFVGGKLGFRRNTQQPKPLIAKAIGVKNGITPSVWDVTAGLAQDAFVLAMLGCSVTMLERNPIVFELIKSGLDCALHHSCQIPDPELSIILHRLNLTYDDFITINHKNFLRPEVIYCDPMFPQSAKAAKVNKGMQLFHQVVGRDVDADKLFEKALQVATHRVVVKRPKHAPFLCDDKPSLQFVGKSVRYDVYPKRKLEKTTELE